MRNRGGFTLVECVVAVALFAIISTLGISMFSSSTRYMSEARKTQARYSEAMEQASADTFPKIFPTSALARRKDEHADDPREQNQVEEDRDSEDPVERRTDLIPEARQSLFVKAKYSTRYGDTVVYIPVALAHDQENVPAHCTRYVVLADGYKNGANGKVKTGRILYVHDAFEYPAGSEWDDAPAPADAS